jgi:hypothetical protein
MKISDIQSLEHLTCIQGEYTDAEVTGGYTSDLLSDVMARADEGSVLITIQAHKNTVAVATLVGIVAIVVCNNREAPGDMLDAARHEGIAVFQTPENQFQTSSRIAQHLARCPAR